MSKQQSKDELMAEFFRMLMADAQQAQKYSGPREEYTMDSFPRYREADHVRKYTVRVVLRGIKPPIWRNSADWTTAAQSVASAAITGPQTG